MTTLIFIVVLFPLIALVSGAIASYIIIRTDIAHDKLKTCHWVTFPFLIFGLVLLLPSRIMLGIMNGIKHMGVISDENALLETYDCMWEGAIIIHEIIFYPDVFDDEDYNPYA